ncbi:MAG: DUF1926 domain-containing protein [Gemmatales bacterium]|nr:DUF1926 domain-containing protein [Gemmatales bacterium]MDW8386234.1 DUF1926 domain-containing protein [Gemmatales bacterium]
MPLRFVFGVHNHQPVGNFDSVFEQAYRDGYTPFLDLIEHYPEVPITLHVSGCLLEWLQAHRPEYVERLRHLVRQGRMEILGGGFYEPILSMLPRWDRHGQIASYTEHLQRLFDCRIRGMWLAERVWEPDFVADLAEAGIEYTLLDDFHFRQAGLDEEQLFGWFLTEDEGRLLKVWPISEPMRYLVPWKSPEEAVGYLREVAHRYRDPVVVCADDGEKFGAWPETHKHCYTDGWLWRFFDLLRANRDWIRFCTLSQALDETASQGVVYLPDCSYREMTEWALPAHRQRLYTELVQSLEHDPRWPRLRSFLRGGMWRNFRAKYPEVREMYCRMLETSSRLHSLSLPAQRQAEVASARQDLYRAQCNCPYWHGAFGGLYLPHLRNAVYHHLIKAENALERVSPDTPPVDAVTSDFNLDTQPEIKLQNAHLAVYVAPHRGGMIYELDVRPIHHNLLATLSRRYEAYHDTIAKVAQGAYAESVVSKVVEGVRFKQTGLEKALIYDRYQRKSLQDHFLSPSTDLAAMTSLHYEELGDFVTGPFDHEVQSSEERVQVTLRRRGQVAGRPLTLTKIVSLKGSGESLGIRYVLEDLPRDLRLRFAVEFQFAGMAAGQEDRYFHYDDRPRAGQLQTLQDVPSVRCFGLTDEWLGLDATLRFSRPTSVWAFPIQTVSQSEGGFEMVHQSTTVMPHWLIEADASGRWEAGLELTLGVIRRST